MVRLEVERGAAGAPLRFRAGNFAESSRSDNGLKPRLENAMAARASGRSVRRRFAAGASIGLLSATVHATPIESVVFVDRKSRSSEELAAVQRRSQLVIAGGALAIGSYGAATWWRDMSGDFRTRNEGWFSQGTADGGAG